MGQFSPAKIENLGSANIAIVVSRYNEKITAPLLDGAINMLDKHGISRDKVNVYYVPGALELAVVARECAGRGADAIICLGAVIRGDTPHFEYVSNTCALSIAQVATNTGVPCIFGVLTLDNETQALERIGGQAGHKGEEAAMSALETIATLREVRNPKESSTGFLG